VSLIDRDGNTIQKIWIEPNSGVMLKRELNDRTGNPMGGFEFVKVNFKPKFDPRDFEINRKGAVVVTQADFARRTAQEHGFSSRLLQPSTGWKVEHSRLLRRPQEPVLAVGYVSSSGRLMIFQHKGQLDSRRLEEMARGEANIHVFTQGGETFVLVSDLPKTTLERLAATLRDS
jgi:negative regulator of sigma E activity